MSVRAFSIGLVVLPFALIDISICVEQLAESVGLIVQPVTLVSAAIRPLLPSEPLSQLIPPFTLIYGATRQSNRSLLNFRTSEGLRLIQQASIPVHHAIVIIVVVATELLARTTWHAPISTLRKLSVGRVVRSLPEPAQVPRVILDFFLVRSHRLLHDLLVDALDDLGIRVLPDARTKNTCTVTHDEI